MAGGGELHLPMGASAEAVGGVTVMDWSPVGLVIEFVPQDNASDAAKANAREKKVRRSFPITPSCRIRTLNGQRVAKETKKC